METHTYTYNTFQKNLTSKIGFLPVDLKYTDQRTLFEFKN